MPRPPQVKAGERERQHRNAGPSDSAAAVVGNRQVFMEHMHEAEERVAEVDHAEHARIVTIDGRGQPHRTLALRRGPAQRDRQRYAVVFGETDRHWREAVAGSLTRIIGSERDVRRFRRRNRAARGAHELADVVVIDEDRAGQRNRHEQNEQADAEPQMNVAPEPLQRSAPVCRRCCWHLDCF